MGKTIFFDAFNGVSGDMILGALLDLGLPLDHLERELARLRLAGYRLHAARVERQGLPGTDFKVLVDSEDRRHHHGGAESHSHPHRSPGAIREMIESSGLDPWVIDTAGRIFQRLGEAEAKVHGTTLEDVHFHEVGGVDSIIDIVGSCIGFRYFDVEDFYASPLALGGGTVSFSHGNWPVPAPATAELVKGFPVRTGPVDFELTTPTGAAIVTTLVRGTAPVLRLERSGFGAGDREFQEIPNMLRLMLAHPVDAAADATEEEIVLLESAIDNMDGELLGHVLELCLNRGALDAYYFPLQMKKSRPGVLLTVLARREDRDRMVELIFQETTTLGVRWSNTRRFVLPRELERVETEYGSIRVKIARWQNRIVNVWPEFDDLREIAERRNLPLKQVRHKVLEWIGKQKI